MLAIRLVGRVAGAAERSKAVASDVFLTNKLPSIRSRLRIDVDDIRAQNSDISPTPTPCSTAPPRAPPPTSNCDLRNPDTILNRAAATLDFTQPVALILAAILHLISDHDHPHRIVERLVEALPSGSHVAISHLSADIQPDAMAELARRLNQSARETFVMRTHAQISRFFDGLELVEPGVVQVDQWRPPKPKVTTSGGWVPSLYAAVGRKP